MAANTKGQLGLQFNRMFVLLVGAVILAFFFTIINNQEKQANAEQATELVENLDTVVKAVSNNPDVVQSFNIAKAAVEFTCEPGLSEYYIQGAGPIDTSHDALFTPAALHGDEIIVWSKTWRAPFPTMVFTHLSNDRTLFIFVNESEESRTLYQDMPDAFLKTLLKEEALEGLEGAGYDRYVIISTYSPELPNEIEDRAHERVVSNTPGELYKQGTVTFKHDGEIESAPYVTGDTLWGAIFTEDAATYNCTLDKARKRQRMVAAIIKERFDMIKEELGTSHRCWNYLDNVEPNLENLVDDQTLEGVASDIEEVRTGQDIIKRGPACPNIY